MPYNTPPTFADDEHLSAYKLRLLAGNDDYFSGIADRYEAPVPTWEGGAKSMTVGCHFFQGKINHVTGRNTLYWEYDWDITGFSTANETITLIIDEGLASEIVASAKVVADGSGTYSGSTNIAALADGLHTVQLIGTWDYCDDANDRPTGVLKYCYEAYTTPLAYAVPTSFTDGNVSAVAHFSVLSDNDSYFRACEPGNHPFAHLGVNATAGGIPGWRAWFKHRAGCLRMYYKNSAAAFDIVINPGGGALEETVTLTGTAVTVPPTPGYEGYHDITVALVDGTWYEITGPVGGGDAPCPDYIGFGRVPASAISGYVPTGEFMPGQFVWGTTANQRTRLELLKSNDVSIQARLNPANYQGRHHAVLWSPGIDKNGNPDAGGGLADYSPSYHYFKHLLPTLSYTGTAVVMEWETDNSITLPTSGTVAGKIDLSSLSDLQVGQMYKITGASWVYEDLS
jgi:hypothetical protein